ncbi:hypothetical protein H634G_11577, partial [Metarhizium anisopliae BRIP 53293]
CNPGYGAGQCLKQQPKDLPTLRAPPESTVQVPGSTIDVQVITSFINRGENFSLVALT